VNEAVAQHSCKVLAYQDPNQGFLDALIDRGLLQRELLRRVDCRVANAVEPPLPEGLPASYADMDRLFHAKALQ
jgi:hypothetical protein